VSRLSDWEMKYTDPAYCYVCGKPDYDKYRNLKRVRRDEAWFCEDCDPEGWLKLHIHGSHHVPILLKALDIYLDQFEDDEERFEKYDEIQDILTTLQSIQKNIEERKHQKANQPDPFSIDDSELPF
jgi:hypothetical protein